MLDSSRNFNAIYDDNIIVKLECSSNNITYELNKIIPQDTNIVPPPFVWNEQIIRPINDINIDSVDNNEFSLLRQHELINLIIERAKTLRNGSKPMINYSRINSIDPVEIAKLELKNNKCIFYVSRKIGKYIVMFSPNDYIVINIKELDDISKIDNNFEI